MTILFDLIYLILVCLGWPLLVYRRLKRGPGSIALSDRLAALPSRPVASRCIWLHGVSLGEINATRTLVEHFRQRSPDAVVVVSSTTQTGLARARQLYPDLLVFRFPLDFSFVIRRALTRLRPSVIVLMELELWPNLVEMASAHDIPMVVVNGRVTEERSMRRFRLPIIRRLSQRMFRQLRWVGAQDQTYASRFVELGVRPDRVQVMGSLKYDTADLTDTVPSQDDMAREMGIDTQRPLWVCGSTGPDEEDIILNAYGHLREHFRDLQLALVPRKPERFDSVADLIVRRGYACLRRSTGAPAIPAGVEEPIPVFLGDTMGELRKLYALATIVFVGRSLVPMGGSDVMEVAGLAKPILVGPYTENFEEAVNLLLAEGACRRVNSAEGLVAAVSDLMHHADRRRKMGQAGRAAIASRQGATARTVEQILEMIASE
ncbi:MAG: 3-deoxy-D-manno-octulosonic acid transferase [Phycisphaerae bacterium]|nr:3-deoxy-D-manno-octulosonic acid transferase [Phycisphaerae bacterium]